MQGAVQKLELIRRAKALRTEKMEKLNQLKLNIKEYLDKKKVESAKQYEIEGRVVQLDTDKSYLQILTERIGSFWRTQTDDEKLAAQLRDEKRQEELDKLKLELEEQKRKVSDLQSDFDRTQQEIQDTEKLLSGFNGPDDCFLTLRKECFEKTVLNYKYKVCMFDSVDQDYTNLGKFTSWDPKLGVMKYEKGQSCWQGPDRSAEVILECYPKHEILSVVEPAKCEYKVRMGSPAMCEIKEGDELLPYSPEPSEEATTSDSEETEEENEGPTDSSDDNSAESSESHDEL
jgi:hypothetical protein